MSQDPFPYKIKYSSKNTDYGVSNQTKGFKTDRERTAWLKKQGRSIEIHSTYVV